MKVKKIPYYVFLGITVIAASTIIGLLSFTGFYAIFPILSVAFIFFGLSVAYEAEMYLQNIKGALNKLFLKPHYIEHHLTHDFLLNNFPDTEGPGCPEFFKDYKAQLELLGEFHHKNLEKESLKRKKRLEKTLRDMEKWFSLQLFTKDEDDASLSAYEKELRYWLSGKKKVKEARNRSRELEKYFAAAKVFSIIAGAFMSLGMTYLLVDSFAVVPLLATLSLTTLPFLIIPMALISGVAYALLIYNAVTDMIINDTLLKLYNKIFIQKFTLRNFAIAVSAVILLSLTIALTVCTAGTWWTIAKQARPLFTWLGNLPHFVMGIVNPIVTGFSQLIFNLENTAESLEILEQATEVNIFKKIWKSILAIYHHVKENENRLQWINIPRIILKITFVPLRIAFFILHLISIGVTADRVPGIPEIVSALLGIICEGFEDLHYFVGDLLHPDEDEHEHDGHELESVLEHDGHKHHHHHHHHHHHDFHVLLQERFDKGHSHDHSDDIPTKILRFLFWPLFRLSAGWDYVATRLVATPSGKALSWQNAVDKQYGLKNKEEVPVDDDAAKPSAKWQVAHAAYRIDRYVTKHLNKAHVNAETARKKTTELRQLKTSLRKIEDPTEESITQCLKTEAEKKIYSDHRFFGYGGKKTRTQDFLTEQLPLQINTAPAA